MADRPTNPADTRPVPRAGGPDASGDALEFVGILPAAGAGSRLQPLPAAKELLPILYVDTSDGTGMRPVAVAEFALASLLRAGVRQCLIITSGDKPELARYFGNGQDRGLALDYLIQAAPRGLADAVDTAYARVRGARCCLALPDTVFGPPDALDQVCRHLLDSGADLVLGVFPVPNPCELGPVRVDPDGTVRAVLEKPPQTELANSWGIAAWGPAFTEFLHARLASEGSARHPSIGTLFNAALASGLRVRAVSFPDGDYLDAGTPQGLKRLLALWSDTREPPPTPAEPTPVRPSQGAEAPPADPMESAPARHARVAVQARDAGRLDEALAHAWSWTDAAPDDARAFLLLGDILGRSGHGEAAREALEQAVRLDPASAAGQRALGLRLADLGDGDAAMRHLEQAIARDPRDLESLIRLGWLLHDAEAFDRLEPVARAAVAAAPRDARAHHLLGWCLMRLGRAAEARAALERAHALAPTLAEVLLGLAMLDLADGEAASAEARLRDAVRHGAGGAEPHRLLAWALYDQGDLAGAEAACRQAIAHDDDAAALRSQLTWILIEAERPDAAAAACFALLDRHPDHAEAYRLMAELHLRAGRFETAEHWFEQALARDPRAAAALTGLGKLHRRLERPARAEYALRTAIDADADHAAAYQELARLYAHQGQHADAERVLRSLLDRKPRDANGWLALGRRLVDAGRDDEAADALCRAVEIERDLEAAWFELTRLHVRNVVAAREAFASWGGTALRAALATLITEAITRFSFDEYRAIVDHARAQFPADDLFGAARQFGLVYDPDQTLATLSAEAQRFAGGAPLPARSRRRGRPRIAYLGNYLHREFMSGYVNFHDYDRFDICVFSDDDVDTKLPFRDPRLAVYPLKEVDLERACALAGIDLAIDLIGPYPRDKLLGPYRALHRRIAPVQCLWINSFGTTGMPGYDYLIADRGLIRPGEERWFSERVVHMPHCQWFWTPPPRAIDPGPLPAETNGYVTFGSINRGLKLNDQVLALWAAVLARLPDARLRLVGWHTEDWRLRRRIVEIFAAHGVTADRLDFVAGIEPERLPTQYQAIDLTLDTFPFNGGLTTLEALWMGAPVIALAGRTFTGRQTETILRVIGRADWIAADRDDFVARAVAVAQDHAGLAAARATLRSQMQASPLCDGPGFARDLEALFDQMLGSAR